MQLYDEIYRHNIRLQRRIARLQRIVDGLKNEEKQGQGRMLARVERAVRRLEAERESLKAALRALCERIEGAAADMAEYVAALEKDRDMLMREVERWRSLYGHENKGGQRNT